MGRELLPILRRGSSGLREMRAEAAALGGGFSAEGIQSPSRYQLQMARLDVTMTSLKDMLAVHLLPAVNKFLELMADVGRPLMEFIRNTHALEIVLGGIAVVAGLVATSLLAIAAPVLVPLGLLALAFEDIMVFLQGGNSALGEFLDSTFGLGTAQQVVETLRGAWDSLTESVRRFYATITGELTGGGVASVEDGLRRQREYRERVQAERATSGGRRGRRVVISRDEARALARPPRVAPRRQGSTTTQTVNVAPPRVTVNVDGSASPQDTARVVVAQVQDQLARQINGAVGALPQGT